MSHAPMPNLTNGVDLGDRASRTYEVNAHGECVREATVPTTSCRATAHSCASAGLTHYLAGDDNDQPALGYEWLRDWVRFLHGG